MTQRVSERVGPTFDAYSQPCSNVDLEIFASFWKVELSGRRFRGS